MQRAVRSYLDHLAVERALSANTLSSYRRDLARYLATLDGDGVADLAAIQPGHVGRYVAALRAGDADHPPLSAASTARAISAVRGLHRFAVRDGLTDRDPTRDLRPPSPPRRLPKALDLDQVERLLAAVDRPETPLGLRDRALLEFLYATGARISEAVGTTIDDLDLADRRTAGGAGQASEASQAPAGPVGTAGGAGQASEASQAPAGPMGTVVLRGKGGKTRLVPMGGYARAALDAYLVRGRPTLAAAGRGVPSVFLNARGGALSRQGAWAILRRAAARAGLAVNGPRGISPHTLRHSYATHLLDGGADVRVVQELLGHASVTTTQVYTLVTVERLREIYATSHPRARPSSP
ncbi:MAG TPA: site-specific tyrosine recombinase XerD [Micromonosporaceae bacterium]